MNMQEIDWNSLKNKLSLVKATNKSLLYNTMLYWSQKPYTVTDELVRFFTNDGDTVMDPFMGSGVTVLEASKQEYKRKSIGIEINDMPIFLCKNSVYLPTEKNYKDISKFKTLIQKYSYLYDTKCENCGNEHATIIKIIYDRVPNLILREIQYECPCCSKTQTKRPSEYDYKSFLESRPTSDIENIALIENSRIAVGRNEKISDKFSKRSFFVLDLIKKNIEQIQDLSSKKVLYYVFASIIHKSKILDIKLSSQWPLWVPKKNCVERNIINTFSAAIEKYVESRHYVDRNYQIPFVSDFQSLKNGSALIIQKGTQNITEGDIPSNSVDFVITDPPYLGQVPYSEYMQLYKGFLGNKINFQDEIVITNAKNREKDYATYFTMMKKAFLNVSRVLKKEAIMCLYFHDSDLSVWSDLMDTFFNAGFSFEGCVHIDKKVKTLKKILDPKKTMSGETLLFFRNSKSSIGKRNFNNQDFENIKRITENIIYSSEEKYATTSQLYDNGVLSYIIKEGILASLASSYKDLTEIFNEILFFDERLGVWRLKPFILEP